MSELVRGRTMDWHRERWEITRSLPWLVLAGVAVYCLVLTIATGDIGFEGDDWWIFGWPFWNAFPYSMWAYARDCLRPVEGIYWIGLFELFGFNKTVFHMFSLLLSVAGCLLMGICLAKAFPRRGGFVAASVFLSFFIPTISSLTYVMTTDNSRLSVLLFWASALSFQRWTERRPSWPGLSVPILFYLLSFLTYEAASMLLFAVPLLVWPVREQSRGYLSDRVFSVRLAVGLMTAFALALALRFGFLSGGAVGHSRLLPDWELIWSYLALLPFYVLAPFTSTAGGLWDWVFGLAVMAWASVVFFIFLPIKGGEQARGRRFTDTRLYLVTLGLGILILGILPYQLAGYGSIPPKLVESALIKWHVIPEGHTTWFNFNWSSRIYSAGSFGLAILLASIFTGWKNTKLRIGGRIALVIGLGFLVAFHAGLRNDWQDAAKMRNGLIRSLISQVPSVEPQTNLVFLDLECDEGRAAVFRGWNGLRELMRMLYSDPTISAWYLYPYSKKPPNRIFQQAIVSPAGFVTRGLRLDEPVPHEKLVLLARKGCDLALLNKITARDTLVPSGIRWDGTSALSSHQGRIIGWMDLASHSARPAKDAWRSGLIATLGLNRVQPDLNMPNMWGSWPSEQNKKIHAIQEGSPGTKGAMVRRPL